MARTPEAKVKDKIKALIKKYDGYYAMPVMRGMAHNGTPDFLCCVNGWFVGIEAKAGKGRPTALQSVRLEEIRKAGGVSVVVNEKNLEELDQMLRRISLTDGTVRRGNDG